MDRGIMGLIATDRLRSRSIGNLASQRRLGKHGDLQLYCDLHRDFTRVFSSISVSSARLLMPKALCLISLVASILIVVLFLADAAMGMLGWQEHRTPAIRQHDDGHRLRCARRGDDLHELVDLPRAAMTRGT